MRSDEDGPDKGLLFESIVTTAQRRQTTFMTSIEGCVGVVDGCFAVEGYLIIFPKDSAEIVDGGRALAYGDQRYGVGDSVSFTGAGIPLDLVPDVIVPPQVRDGRRYFLTAPAGSGVHPEWPR